MNKYIPISFSLLTALTARADLVAEFNMTVSGGNITEKVSGQKFAVEGHFSPENVAGAVGDALRFDGYTSHINASLGDILPENTNKLTVSLWAAVPSYPIIQLDTNTSEQTPIVSCLDADKKSGFGFYLGFNGQYSFRIYLGGWLLTLEADKPLPTYEWNHLVAVIDGESRTAKLYNNGEEVGSGRANGSVSFSPCNLYMGQGTVSRKTGPFELMSYNGLIDDVCIWNEVKDVTELSKTKPENSPSLNIPASRFADDLLRPRFHGMPAAGWTNECHGMYHSDGRYHLFFQKNGDGPYMARLHWGHISSDNLYDWREEKIALAPGDWYDIKGCWSGCVFADDVVTGGKPNIIYTAVDYAKAMIAQASPQSESLDNWTKFAGNPIINGRPSGLSDDFRDPYFFRNANDAYIIVGTSKNGIGATTLHKYNAAAGTWSNTGDIFFSGASASLDGTFWEMPNITKMENGKWLFTVTPLSTGQGVKTLYWVGDIDSEGHFVSETGMPRRRQVELISKEGFGLLSPTIYPHNGKTIVLGIVPDKLPAQSNWDLGWAHCYSLPREWTLAADGTLIQKPYEGLTGMRSDVKYEQSNFSLENTLELNPVAGRAAEICLEAEIGSSIFGFNIFKSAGSQAVVSYNPAKGTLTADFSGLRRLVNDNGVYNGIYECELPEKPKAGETLKIDMFMDHSILDIFVNDRWATSIRVFPTEADADGIELFAEGKTNIKAIRAWTLKGDNAGVKSVTSDELAPETTVDVFTITGINVKKQVDFSEAFCGLAPGIYVVNDRKYIVK